MVDLEGEDYAVLDMIKNNPKVDLEYTSGGISFKYRAKYDIRFDQCSFVLLPSLLLPRNRDELMRMINRVKNGIPEKDIVDCYPGIRSDVAEMILGGEVIGCKSKDSTVLFPRGDAFLSVLSGTVTARPGQQQIDTHEDLRVDIRRGDAIRVGGNWFRVASAIGSGKSNQPIRAKAPLSVTSVQNLSKRNEYINEFTEVSLPLDGDYDGTEQYSGVAYKYGCTNDIRDKWGSTADTMKRFRNETDLHMEMKRLKLISHVGTVMSVLNVRRDDSKGKDRKRVKRRNLKTTNLHLMGSDIARAVAADDENAA